MLRRLVLAVSLLAPASATADQLAGRVSVIDGDTLELHGQRIRLFGIDAPEAGQACWTANSEAWRCDTAAARALDDLVRGRTVTCKARDRRITSVDEGEALAEGNRVARDLVARAGLQSHLRDPGWGQLYRTFDAPVDLPEN